MGRGERVQDEQKVMLITGTRKGIGRYLAEYYVKKGYVVYGCSRSPIDYELNNYHHFCLDVTDERKVMHIFSQIRTTHQRLDVLINNAAVNLTRSPLLLVPYQSALKTVEINLLGTFLMSREASKMMMRQSSGKIINFSSMVVKHEVEGEALYTASKAAVISLSRVMAKELCPYGITCNVVAPSALTTDLMKDVEAEKLQLLLQRNAIHETGKMEDITNTIDWLLSKESSAITGQVIYLGGA
jgi:3-oxoacyl-[acyl-carrier protein] reductase